MPPAQILWMSSWNPGEQGTCRSGVLMRSAVRKLGLRAVTAKLTMRVDRAERRGAPRDGPFRRDDDARDLHLRDREEPWSGRPRLCVFDGVVLRRGFRGAAMLQ